MIQIKNVVNLKIHIKKTKLEIYQKYGIKIIKILILIGRKQIRLN